MISLHSNVWNLSSPSYTLDCCCSYSIWDSVHCVPGCGALISLFAAFQKGENRPFVQERSAGKSHQYTPDLTFPLILSNRLFTSGFQVQVLSSHLSCCCLSFPLFSSTSFCSLNKERSSSRQKRCTEQTDEGQQRWRRESEDKSTYRAGG